MPGPQRTDDDRFEGLHVTLLIQRRAPGVLVIVIRGIDSRFRHISMLTGSRFIKLTADFVRRFAELGDLMRIYTDPSAFDGALSNAIGNAAPPG